MVFNMNDELIKFCEQVNSIPHTHLDFETIPGKVIIRLGNIRQKTIDCSALKLQFNLKDIL